MKIVFASHNPGKIHELQNALASFQLEVIPQATLNVEEVEETGLTFVENAILKARYASEQTGMPAIGDDSGLEVSALNGAPGIYSARFAGMHGNTEANNQKLLRELKSVPDENRVARYYCVLVYLTSKGDPTPLICEGIWNGTLLKAPQGTQGFGYDPLFYDENEKCSAAELPLARKNQISHRGRALQLLLKRLPEKLKNNETPYARFISQKS